ncbi:hypothetical protein EN45_095490 [Penicillium chrysogenum]|uniref:Uncharacterized protein n=1 Tax=Penicillium chrysogenum TaxID=5076 RepID=A0A162CR96_PENCH|nr:uncharacterized protein N7525_001387 [Penicillium rubens]KAJ5034626.1 hypothetical protein NUH16_006068 [Penicillium rubens]KAJ5843646.1 hypothetical protein N7525_001387 [Penicillium rubens]KAJ5845767.1 hypothetical protein N7534_009436 [Penicillium rubens]KZN85370.1 hypothetical protein EN45_095490 [Penicillium chrysogenum]
MAPISGLVNDNMLSPRADKQYVVDMEKELSITKMLLGFMGAAWLLLLGCTLYTSLRPKYEERWKPKLKPKLRDCKEKYEGWKKKMAWHAKEPKAPEPAHVARHISQAPDVKQITRDLSPEYMKMSTAAIA